MSIYHRSVVYISMIYILIVMGFHGMTTAEFYDQDSCSVAIKQVMEKSSATAICVPKGAPR